MISVLAETTISCPKSGQKEKKDTNFTNNKTAATPIFCKQNFRLTLYIEEINVFGRKGERNWS